MYLIHEVELLFLSTLGTEILSLAARCYTPGDVERVDKLIPAVWTHARQVGSTVLAKALWGTDYTYAVAASRVA